MKENAKLRSAKEKRQRRSKLAPRRKGEKERKNQPKMVGEDRKGRTAGTAGQPG